MAFSRPAIGVSGLAWGLNKAFRSFSGGISFALKLFGTSVLVPFVHCLSSIRAGTCHLDVIDLSELSLITFRVKPSQLLRFLLSV